MYTIAKKFSFSAAHQLHGLKEGHPCGRLHGHNYEVEIVFCSRDLDKHGFVIDYRELDAFKTFLDEYWDHRNLNEIIQIDCPTTAENLAAWLYVYCVTHFAAEVCKVRLSETPKTWAEYSEDPMRLENV